MAKIQTLKNKDDVIIYPQTHGTAVFVNEGELLQDKIEQYLTSEEVGEVENVDITAELTSNKVTSIRDTSTDLQYPSAKAVYDFVSNAETGVKIEIYASKEAVAAPNGSTIYLIGTAVPYEEYLYLEDTATWELIGNASVDLSECFKITGGTLTGDIVMTSGTNIINSTSDAQIKFLENGNIRIDAPLTSGGSAAITIGRAGINLINGTTAVIQTNETGVSLKANTSMTSHGLTDLIDPINAQDAATKNYVDTVLSGKASSDEIPTNLSQLNNDKGYVSSAADSPNLIKYIWLGTQEEYDALTSLDSNTEYNIIEEE